MDADALPSDVEAALRVLERDFPRGGSPVFALRTQLYALVSSRTAVDRELDERRRAFDLRLFYVASGRDDMAVMRATEFEALIGEAEARADDETQTALGVFRDLVRDVCDAALDRQNLQARLVQTAKRRARKQRDTERRQARELDAAFALADRAFKRAGHREKQAPNGDAGLLGMGKASERRLTTAALEGVAEAWISAWVRLGFLVAHSLDTYYLAIPRSGPVIRALASGRREILQILRRQQFKDMLQSVLATKRSSSSPLPFDFVLRDMLGASMVVAEQKEGGTLIRIVRGGAT